MEEFVAALEQSIEKNKFAKLTLSKTISRSSNLENIYIRRIDLKDGIYLSFTYHYTTSDVVKNYTITEAIAQLYQLLGKEFLIATLLSTEEDVMLKFNKKGVTQVQRRKPTIRTVPDTVHNKAKNYLVEEDSPFLERLGIASHGKVLKTHQDKYRQINKYVEIMESLLLQTNLPTQPQIVDMGCGKGYLTFALYDYLQQQTGLKAEITGIELREHLTSFCTEQAKALGWDKLNFVAQDIFDYDNNKIDVLIALHACDIATDIAIAKGIQANAQLIVTAPCCHKQIRKAMSKENSLQQILKHGILEERQAEIITDGIRALLLEAYGYQTKVFEFVSLEHTAKNLMITAVKSANSIIEKPSESILEEVAIIKKQFGINEHYLEKLLQTRG